MKIAVLAGGFSPERDVSLTSGSLIANALQGEGHSVLLVDAYLGVELDPAVPVEQLFSTDTTYSYAVSEEEPDLEALRENSGMGDALIGRNVIAVCKAADIVFLALHGASGENGQIQATLDAYGIRYTGSDYVGSLLAMDKDISKKLLSAAGVRCPIGKTILCGEADEEMIEKEVGYPAVIKPCSCGSSVGISMADNREELERALRLAAKYEERILVERRIVGREFTVGVLDGLVLPPIEIIPRVGFYDYKNKYQVGLTKEICPAKISEEETRELGEIALRAFSALRLRDYARFDFIQDQSGVFWCLEANTLPGMTPTSLLPQEAESVGISYGALCARIAELALKH